MESGSSHPSGTYLKHIIKQPANQDINSRSRHLMSDNCISSAACTAAHGRILSGRCRSTLSPAVRRGHSLASSHCEDLLWSVDRQLEPLVLLACLLPLRAAAWHLADPQSQSRLTSNIKQGIADGRLEEP